MSKAKVIPHPLFRQPTYEIIRSFSGHFWVLRVAGDNRAQLIERFEDRSQAEDFMAFLHEINQAPRRLASH